MSSDVNSTNNVRTNDGVYSTQEAVADIYTKVNSMFNGGKGIISTSYTSQGGKKTDLNKEDVEAILKNIENFKETINLSAVSEEVLKNMGINCQGMLRTLTNVLSELVKNMGASQEVTQEDTQLKTAAQNAIDKLLNSKTISDFDIRELMKLLIKAYSELMKSQREITLATITGIIDALNTKIQAMEISRDENYKAAMAQAVGQIVAGCIQVTASFTQAVCAFAEGAYKTNGFGGRANEMDAHEKAEVAMWKSVSAFAKAFGDLSSVSSGIVGIIAASHSNQAKTADITSAKADAMMEVLRKMQEENSNQLRQLFDFISTLLRTMQELQQNASATEKSIVQA